MLKKILKAVLIVFAILITVFLIIFVKPNLSIEDVEDIYFTEHSHRMNVTIDDLEGNPLEIDVHYQDMGNIGDPVVVLIHGAFSSSHTFIPWANELVEEGYRVILPDLPYFGLTGGFKDNITSFRRSSEVVKYILDELDITKVHIAGNSLGGAVSWYFTSEYQELVDSLTLIDSVYLQGSDDGRAQLREIAQYDFLANIMSTFTPKFLLRTILSSAYGDPELFTEETLDRYYTILRKEGTRKAILQTFQEEVTEFTHLERLESITVPTYIIWGEKDTWIEPSTIDQFQETMNIPEENIYIYQGVGHLPMEEAPLETVEDYIQIISNH